MRRARRQLGTAFTDGGALLVFVSLFLPWFSGPTSNASVRPVLVRRR